MLAAGCRLFAVESAPSGAFAAHSVGSGLGNLQIYSCVCAVWRAEMQRSRSSVGSSAGCNVDLRGAARQLHAICDGGVAAVIRSRCPDDADSSNPREDGDETSVRCGGRDAIEPSARAKAART